MSGEYGIEKPDLTVLPQMQARLTFIYLERCSINREDGALVANTINGVIYIPAAMISVLMLGPGTDITHRAMELLCDCGVSVVWVGEQGLRFYAGGRSLTHQSQLLTQQAKFASNERLHLFVARKMYEMRFPNEDVSKLTMQQLRGKEGARVRRTYRHYSELYNVEWNGREYNPEDFSSSDTVNKALTTGNMCLYGLAHAVIVALGCSPGLGFVHVGHERSFVYDIADLYKAEVVIPLAFQLAAEEGCFSESEMRKKMRETMLEKHILERMVKDIHTLLSEGKELHEQDVVFLWDLKKNFSSGTLYSNYEGNNDEEEF